MLKYELAIFDMDGTILNTIEDLADSVNYALSEAGYPERTLKEIQSFVGNGIRVLIERAVPNQTSVEGVDRVYQSFVKYYKDNCANKTRPYEGIIELINRLRKSGIKTAVVSNKADFGVKILCEQYFDNLFDYAVGERPGVQKKPAPDSVNEVLSALNIHREKAVYIGDSDVDLETAENAGMDCIGVEWGFRGREFLIAHGAVCVVANPEELFQYFFSL